MMKVSQTVRWSGGAGIFKQIKNILTASNNNRSLYEVFGKSIRLRFKLQRERFLFSTGVKFPDVFRLVLSPKQLPIQWVPWDLRQK